MDDSSIKENICNIRTKRLITQTEMAQHLGMDRNTYRCLEKGKTRILNEHLGTIASLLGTTVEELLLGYKPMSGSESQTLDEASVEYSRKYEDLSVRYEADIKVYKDRIRDLEAVNQMLQRRIEDKDEIISLLKRKNI